MSAATAMLERLLDGELLGEQGGAALMQALTDQDLPPALAGALLAALRARGENAEELRGLAAAMRGLARRFDVPAESGAADVVGTGGDGSGSFNLSTGAALLASACGVPVVKHGNRSVSSRSGSADLLEALGITLPMDAAAAGQMLADSGFTFLFAPHFHPAMKAVAPVRKALGVRTVFNVLGPLTNPAAPPFGVVGAFDLSTARLLADALAGLPIQRYFVIHGEPGWDEATPVGPFALFDVRPGRVERRRRDPQRYGLERCAPEALAGGNADTNAQALEAVFTGTDRGPHADALALGAGLVLEVTGRSRGLARGIRAARRALEDGSAARQLERLRKLGGVRG